MKTIGMIGGMSWESSIEYYRIINETVNARLGGFHSAKCLMYSVDFAEIEKLQHLGKWDEATALMIDAGKRVQSGGADFLIKITYVVMLGVVGTFMFFESLYALRKQKAAAAKGEEKAAAKPVSQKKRLMASLPLQTYFEKSGVTHSAIVPLILGVFVGVLAAIMGVGGGFLMVPVMIYMLRMPMHVVVGTSLFQIMFTCTEVTFLQAYSNHTVDFLLAILLLIGSVFGAQIGTTLGKKLHGDQLKILLAIIVLAVTVKIILELVLEPTLLLAYKGGH